MIEITEMEKMLTALVSESQLDKLFKPGRIKSQDKKLPHWVTMRLKLHNPYGFTEFELTEKKTGLKFCVHHLKDLYKPLRLELLNLGGSPDNGNTRFEFDVNEPEGNGLMVAKKIYKILLTPQIIALCQAQDYKPVKIILAEQEEA
jgi:hypothetical protein